MKNILLKTAIVPVLVLGGIPAFLFFRSMGNIMRLTEETPVQAQKTSQNELSYQTNEEKKVEFIPERIVIPNASIDLPVVTVPMTNGTWEVYPGVANYAAETSKVNLTSGNVGIYGHNRKNAFANIKNLVEGSAVEIYGGNYIATYRVTKTQITQPNAVDVFYPTDEPILTLLTCEGVYSDKRYVLQAKLVSVKEGNNEKIN